jgi:transcriptional regulator with XRE-family HTH domain
MVRRRTNATVAGDREATAIAATIGGRVRSARVEVHLTIEALARRVGISPSRLGDAERGLGATMPLRTWVRLGIALDRPLAVTLTDVRARGVADAGHLELQEWVLRIARGRGWKPGLEVPTRATDPRYSIDVLVRAGERLLLLECWNTMRDFGAAVRSTQRKIAEAEELAVAVGAAGVHACWLVRPTAANRDLVRLYPEAIRARFEGSLAWVRVFRDGAAPPPALGFVWLDPSTGVSALRLRG